MCKFYLLPIWKARFEHKVLDTLQILKAACNTALKVTKYEGLGWEFWLN